jgi:hypothetical protein
LVKLKNDGILLGHSLGFLFSANLFVHSFDVEAMKAYGFPIREYLNGDVSGSVYSEKGAFLGGWISSDLEFLKEDLAKYALGYEYHFVLDPPDFFLRKNWESDCRNVLNDIFTERRRQHAKWGVQNWPNGTGSEDDIEFAAQAKRICDFETKIGNLTWRHILAEEFHEALAESDPNKLYVELVQVAAVACQWAEAIRRKKLD